MPSDIDDKVANLEQRAEHLRSLLRYAPRAFVMEFAGTPKSGKSTLIEGIRHFFSRHGFRVHVLTERAALCPIPMKGHLFFNTWCATNMLAELLANVETETDIVIVDRGLLDALVWLALQEKRGEVTAAEAKTIESFLLLERWRSLIDLGVVMSVSAQEAIDRENNQRITHKDGSIMNLEVLTAITQSVDLALERYSRKFSGIIKHETTGQQVRESLVELANRILDCFQRFLNPDILVVPRQQIESLPFDDSGVFGEQAVQDALTCIESYGRFMPRDEAETNFEYVQVIPCGLLEYKDQVFLLRRKDTDPKYRLYGRATIWHGCHVSRREEYRIAELLEAALLARVSRSLFLSRVFPIESLGYCWDRDDEISSRHFGMVYRIQINNPHTAADLKKKEFRKQRGHGLTGQFLDWKQLSDNEVQTMLESWSQAILRGIGKEK